MAPCILRNVMGSSSEWVDGGMGFEWDWGEPLSLGFIVDGRCAEN